MHPTPSGKTLLAKAVANQTSATFLRVVGSELIQKYLGDGPKLVRELFRVADDLSPSIVFIDEIDAVGTKRYVPQCVCLYIRDVLDPCPWCPWCPSCPCILLLF
jgi:ATP-dependent 26S proteasome regulatory subunit